MRKTTLALVCVFSFTLLLGKKFWEEKPYTQWTEQQALSILAKSPWVEEQTFGHADSVVDTTAAASASQVGSDPGAGGPTPVQLSTEGSDLPPSLPPTRTLGMGELHRYQIRFQSVPVRMAQARLAVLKRRVTAEEAQQYVETVTFGDSIVVAVSATAVQDRAELDRLTTERLKDSTYLLLRKSKAKIPLDRYLTPSVAGGSDAIFLFPRTKEGKESVTVADEEVRFVSRLNSRSELNTRFSLKNMLVNGKLEI